MKKGVNWIENQGENRYKMLDSCQLIDFGEKLTKYMCEY